MADSETMKMENSQQFVSQKNITQFNLRHTVGGQQPMQVYHMQQNSDLCLSLEAPRRALHRYNGFQRAPDLAQSTKWKTRFTR